ncbi:MAG: hypothetical protein ACI936_002864 [Paraglaciecola sp.]|jgi:hypothetical protein
MGFFGIAADSRSNARHANNTEVNYIHRSSGWVVVRDFLVSDGGTTLSSINNPSINANANVHIPLPVTTAFLGLGTLDFGAHLKTTNI